MSRVGRRPLNWAKCLDCESIVISLDRHDFQSCECGKLSVDGGFDYARRVGNYEKFVNLDNYGRPREKD